MRRIAWALTVAVLIGAAIFAYLTRYPQRAIIDDESATIWLPSANVAAIHRVNGLVDAPVVAGETSLGVAPASTLVRLRDRVVVVDSTTRRVLSVENSTLDGVAAAAPASLTLATDGSTLYALSEGDSRVFQVDARSLSSIGSPMSVGEIRGWIGARGALWVLVPDGVVEIEGGRQRHIAVRDPLDLATSRDGVAVLAGTGGTVHFLRDGAVRRTLDLPRHVPHSGAPRLAASPDSDAVAVLDAAGTLDFHDADRPSREGTITLPLDRHARPFISGERVYLARGGSLVVVTTTAAPTLDATIVVSASTTKVDLFQADDFLWANTDGPDAVAIYAGKEHHLVKYGMPPSPTPTPDPTPAVTPTVAPTTTQPHVSSSRPPTTRTTTRTTEPGHAPTTVPSTTGPADPNAECGGKNVAISVARPERTGGSPEIEVQICTGPEAEHQYWIVDRGDDGDRWWAKRAVGGSGTYRVELKDGALPGSGRTFYVVDAHGEDIQWLRDLADNDSGAGGVLPSTIIKVSLGVHTIR